MWKSTKTSALLLLLYLVVKVYSEHLPRPEYLVTMFKQTKIMVPRSKAGGTFGNCINFPNADECVRSCTVSPENRPLQKWDTNVEPNNEIESQSVAEFVNPFHSLHNIGRPETSILTL